MRWKKRPATAKQWGFRTPNHHVELGSLGRINFMDTYYNRVTRATSPTRLYGSYVSWRCAIRLQQTCVCKFQAIIGPIRVNHHVERWYNETHPADFCGVVVLQPCRSQRRNLHHQMQRLNDLSRSVKRLGLVKSRTRSLLLELSCDKFYFNHNQPTLLLSTATGRWSMSRRYPRLRFGNSFVSHMLKLTATAPSDTRDIIASVSGGSTLIK